MSDASPANTLASPAPAQGPTIPQIARDLLLAAKAFRSLTIVFHERMDSISKGSDEAFSPEEVSSLETIEAVSSTWTTAMNGIKRLEAMITPLVGSTAMVHGAATTQSAMGLGRDEAAGSCECRDCELRRAKAVGKVLAVATTAGRS